MSEADYQRWLDRGSPFRLMTPATSLRDKLLRHGYVVYGIGNRTHMVHEPPEDHTPYSETTYPASSSIYGVGYAIDIMPPASGQRSRVDGLPLPSLGRLGAQLVADRSAGVPGIRWLKYINWEPAGAGGPCYQDSWKPNHAQRSSSDRGHLHLSGLTGFESSTVGADYDPVARIRGGDDMSVEAENQIAALHRELLGPGSGVYPAHVVEKIRDVAWALVKGNEANTWVGKQFVALRVELAAQRSLVESLAQAVATGGGSIDTAAILAGVERSVAQAVEQLKSETRDAVADLGEGGAEQVRAG